MSDKQKLTPRGCSLNLGTLLYAFGSEVSKAHVPEQPSWEEGWLGSVPGFPARRRLGSGHPFGMLLPLPGWEDLAASDLSVLALGAQGHHDVAPKRLPVPCRLVNLLDF